MGLYCLCAQSRAGKILKCRTIKDEKRELIFSHFWSQSWEEKRMYVSCLINVEKPTDTRHRKVPGQSKRNHTLRFHLKIASSRIRVCKKLFMNTLAIKDWSASKWVMNYADKSASPPEVKEKPLKKGQRGIRFSSSLNVYQKCPHIIPGRTRPEPTLSQCFLPCMPSTELMLSGQKRKVQ